MRRHSGKKRLGAVLLSLALCLGLLPVTALAAGEDVPNVLYVGTTNIGTTSYNDNAAYWTSEDGGTTWNSQQTQPEGDSYIYYDGQGTLKLHNVTIQGQYDDSKVFGAGIYALCGTNQSVSLTIQLTGNNTITGDFGIYVEAQQGGTLGANASLSITGDGSLTVTGTASYGLYVKSGTGDASLTIKNASVDAKTTQTYFSYAGVCVQSGASATGSPQLSLAVNGGSLTASGTGSNDGILFYVGQSQATGATTSLTVSENAIVDARNGGISATGVNITPKLNIGSTGSTGGIVWNGAEGTVYGKVELQKDLEIKSGETLTIPGGASLTSNDKLTNNGTVTIENGGTLTDADKVTNSGTINVEDGGKLEGTPTGGTVVKAPTITTESPLPEGTVGTEYSQTLAAENNPTSWSVTIGTLPAGLTLDTNTGTISGIPTAEGSSAFTVTAENSAGSATQEYTLTIKSVPVASVSLNESNLSLYTGKTATLTATVTPENATNKAVTWESSDDTIATVDNNGKVTAVKEGTATITATAADGSGEFATCTVTVERPYVPPANPNYRIDVTTTAGGTVTKDPAAAKAGETVTLTPTPDAGYEVGTVTVTDRFGEAVEVTENADGTYTFTMPNGQVSVEVTFVEAAPEPLPFTDVNEGDWFHDAVQYVYDNGLMDGVGEGQFAPNATTTRAQLVTILYRLAGEPAVSGDVGFTDVESGLWYTNAVAWAAANGIVNGISETEFAPSGDLTREQLATILFRYAESMGYDVSASADLSGFPDAGDIQSYATQALSWAVAEGFLQGFEDDSLQPQSTATRAQIATILMRFCETVAK